MKEDKIIDWTQSLIWHNDSDATEFPDWRLDIIAVVDDSCQRGSWHCQPTSPAAPKDPTGKTWSGIVGNRERCPALYLHRNRSGPLGPHTRWSGLGCRLQSDHHVSIQLYAKIHNSRKSLSRPLVAFPQVSSEKSLPFTLTSTFTDTDFSIPVVWQKLHLSIWNRVYNTEVPNNQPACLNYLLCFV